MAIKVLYFQLIFSFEVIAMQLILICVLQFCHYSTYWLQHSILGNQFRNFKTERISSKENDEKILSRLREMLLLHKGSDLKNDIFSDLEANKWKGNINTNFNLRFWY